MDDENAPPFNVPVNPEKLNIPQYPLIIKHPMDLGTIKATLEKPRSRDRYKTLKDFASKVRLVFDNARTFNQSGSQIYNSADYLSKLFETKYAELQKALGLPKSYDPPKEFIPPPLIPAPVGSILEPPIVARRNNFKEGSTAPVDAKKPKRRTQRQPTSQRPTKKKKTSESDTKSQQVTIEEKKQLHDVLSNLNENDWTMGKVMEIIAPNSTQVGSGELEIDVDNLPVPTIRKLQRFVKDHLNNPNPPSNLPPPGENPSKGVDSLGFDSDEDDENDPDFQSL